MTTPETSQKSTPLAIDLASEAIMVDLLQKGSVWRADLPDHLKPHWDAFFNLNNPDSVGRVRFHEFYNHLLEALATVHYQVNKAAIVNKAKDAYSAFLKYNLPLHQHQVDTMRETCKLLNPAFESWVNEGISLAVLEFNNQNTLQQ